MKLSYDLETLFIKAFENEELQAVFFEQLLENNIYVIGNNEEDTISFCSLFHEDEVFIPIFLSKQSVLHFLDGEKMQYICMNGEEVLEMIQYENIVINPGQRDSIVFYADEIQEILKRGKEKVVLC